MLDDRKNAKTEKIGKVKIRRGKVSKYSQNLQVAKKKGNTFKKMLIAMATWMMTMTMMTTNKMIR